MDRTLGAIYALEAVELLTYAAAVTTRMRLGAAVLLTALHSPVHMAKRLATLDALSGGRLIVGVGLGGDPKVYPAHGLSAERRAARFEEGIEVMKRLWTEPRVTFNGQFFSLQPGGRLQRSRCRSRTRPSGSAPIIRTPLRARWRSARASSAPAPRRPASSSTRCAW